MNKEDREELMEMLDLYFKPFTERLGEHHRTLFGNGTDGNQGLRVDVDRIKQAENSRTWHIRTLWVGIVATAIKGVWDAITKH